MAEILGVGGATLDIVNVVAAYPEEDSEVRAEHQRVRLGGNVANTLAVLAQLGHRCAWSGVWADEPDGRRIVADLEACGVRTDPARGLPAGKSPTSYITLSRANGSRTIIHCRDLPELDAATFEALDVTPYRWVHVEARPNTSDVLRMIRHVRRHNPRAWISLEVEKARDGLAHCLHDPDVLLFSGDYARRQGHAGPEAFLRSLDPAAVPGLKVCTWGAEGAMALDNAGRLHHRPAHPPARVVDTVGAGDTFNAGLIDAMARGRSLDEALEAAVRLAGRKCGQEGLGGLAEGPA
ncbi:PfkB family carbohydrate kinase [Thiohalorhabdus methylotrophus]|uniref:PfkB family carbohydrate kinase n=1 Tax=Thiohalorhabdus methylotrophus TaxID=3242694 RepID=A0ABV4TTM7_9GAMM